MFEPKITNFFDNMEDTKPKTNPQYAWAVVIIFAITVLAVFALVKFVPEEDHTAHIITIVGLLAPTISSIFALMKAQETHLAVNSRLDSFIEQSGLVERAEGYEAGREDANKRTDALKVSKKL